MTPGRKFPPRKQNRRENVNETIRAREVRAVFPNGETEIMPTAAALRKAQEMGLDLVLIAPTAVPPVAKAIDYGHYQYELKKKQHEAKKKQHVVQVKELKFRPYPDQSHQGHQKHLTKSLAGEIAGPFRLPFGRLSYSSSSSSPALAAFAAAMILSACNCGT